MIWKKNNCYLPTILYCLVIDSCKCLFQICDMDNDQILKDDEVHNFQVSSWLITPGWLINLSVEVNEILENCYCL